MGNAGTTRTTRVHGELRRHTSRTADSSTTPGSVVGSYSRSEADERPSAGACGQPDFTAHTRIPTARLNCCGCVRYSDAKSASHVLPAPADTLAVGWPTQYTDMRAIQSKHMHRHNTSLCAHYPQAGSPALRVRAPGLPPSHLSGKVGGMFACVRAASVERARSTAVCVRGPLRHCTTESLWSGRLPASHHTVERRTDVDPATYGRPPPTLTFPPVTFARVRVAQQTYGDSCRPHPRASNAPLFSL